MGRPRRWVGVLRPTIGLLLLAAALSAPATAAADPQWRVDVLRTWDGRGTVSAEALAAPGAAAADADAKLELVRAGAVVAERSTTVPNAGGRVSLDLESPAVAGDVIRYRSPPTDLVPDVELDFAGGPTIADDACAGATSFTGLHGGDASTGLAAGASGPGEDTLLVASAAPTSASAYSATLDSPLQSGALAWVETAATVSDVLLAARVERRVLDCAKPPGGEEETPPGDVQVPPPGPEETVHTAPPATVPPDVKAPSVTVAAAKGRIKSLIRYGFAYEARCDEACAAAGSLLADARTARKLKLGKAATVLATATTKLTAGRPVVVLKLKRTVARRLKKLKSLKLQVVTVVADPAGNSATAVSSAKFRR